MAKKKNASESVTERWINLSPNKIMDRMIERRGELLTVLSTGLTANPEMHHHELEFVEGFIRDVFEGKYDR